MDGFATTFETVVGVATEITEELRKPKTVVLYKDKDLVHLSPFSLQPTRWNPYQRTVIKESLSSAMGVLLDAIKRFDRVVVPVVIDVCGNLIEGNRRVAGSCWLIYNNYLQKDFTLPCYVVQCEGHSSGELFAYINRARQQINSSVFLEIYEHNQEAVVEEKREEASYFAKMMGGPEKLTNFVKAGGKGSYLKPIRLLVQTTGLDAYTIGMWLARYNLCYKVKKLLRTFDRDDLINLITKNVCPNT